MTEKVIYPPSPSERGPVLTAIRNRKMARSAHAYVRGSTEKFYQWLRAASSQRIPRGPPIWICGDCHLGNLGPVADCDAKIDVQMRDFDQAVVGNPAHDLVRLALSLASAARGSDLPGHSPEKRPNATTRPANSLPKRRTAVNSKVSDERAENSAAFRGRESVSPRATTLTRLTNLGTYPGPSTA